MVGLVRSIVPHNSTCNSGTARGDIFHGRAHATRVGKYLAESDENRKRDRQPHYPVEASGGTQNPADGGK